MYIISLKTNLVFLWKRWIWQCLYILATAAQVSDLDQVSLGYTKRGDILKMSFLLNRQELNKWFWRIRFLKFVRVFSLFRYHLSLKKGVVLYLRKFESPSAKIAWLKLARLFWRRRWKCEKFTDRRTADGQRAIRKPHLSFKLRWAENKKKLCMTAMSLVLKSLEG